MSILVNKILESAQKYDGTKYVLGGDGTQEGGTDCGKYLQDTLNDAGIPWESRYVPHMITEGKAKGLWADAASGYTPQPGDLAVVDGDNHAVLVDADGGTRQAGSGTGYVYKSNLSPQAMFGNVTGYIRTGSYYDGASPLDIYSQNNMVNEVGVPVAALADMAERQDQQTQEQPNASFGERFDNSWNQSIPGGAVRSSWLNFSTEYQGGNYKFTKDDVDYVNSKLNGNKTAQTFVYAHASSRDKLEELVALKVQDLELEKRVNASPVNINSFGTVAGMLLGEVTNPVNYIPLATLNKGALAMRMLKQGTANAALNTIDSDLRERLTGYEQDYKAAAMTGAIVGAALPFVGRMVKGASTKEIKELNESLERNLYRIGEDSKNVVEGKASAQFTGRIKEATQLHLKDFDVSSSPIKNLIEDGRAIVVSKDNMQRLRNLFKQAIPDNASAFHYKGLTVFFKESIEGLNDAGVRGLLLHEVGIHGLDAAGKKPLLDYTKQAMKKPTGYWKEAIDRATANTPEGLEVDPEEVLGYFVELVETKGSKGGNYIKLKNIVKEMFSDENLTDKDVFEAIKKNTAKLMDSHNGYQVLEDGSVITNSDIKMSAHNILNPNNYERLISEDPSLGAQSALQKGFGRAGAKLGDLTENGMLTRTYWGAMYNSKSATARKYVGALIEDARRRSPNTMGRVVKLPAETLKQSIMQDEFMPLLVDIQENFMSYMSKTHGNWLDTQDTTKIEDAWKQIVQYHDHVFAGHGKFNPEIPEELKSIAQQLNALEKKEVEVATRFGFLDKQAAAAFDTGTRRVTNGNKWSELLTSYKDNGTGKGLERLNNDLYQYGKAAMNLKRDENAAIVKGLIDTENEVAKKKFEDAMETWEASGQFTGKPKPTFTPKELTEDAIDEYIDKEAKNWAYGQLDRNTSNLHIESERGNSDHAADFLHHRVRMDTSHEVIMNGKIFSFDNDLRSYDMFSILGHTTNRWAGEIALHNSLVGKVDFQHLITGEQQVTANVKNLRTTIERELTQAGASSSEKSKALRAFDSTIKNLRGFYTGNGTPGRGDAISDLIRNITYARVGGNFGINQLGEINGLMAYNGVRSLFTLFPGMRTPFAEAMYGKQVTKEGMEQMAHLFQRDLNDISVGKQLLLTSKTGQRLDPLQTGGSWIDSMNNFVKVGTTITSQLSGLQKLTKKMTEDAKWYTYIDLYRFAKGETVGGFTRNPFSAGKMASIGVTDIPAFQAKLKTFLTENGKALDLNRMKKDDVAFYYQCYQYIDNQVKRALTTPTIGNKNMLAETNAFAKIFFQFKSFANLATNAGAMRTLTHRERDDVMTWVYSFFTAGAVNGMRYYADSIGKHPGDPSAQQAYRDKHLTWDNMAKQAVLRSSVAAGLTSHVTDGFGMIGWEPWTAYRSTVDTSKRAKYAGKYDFASQVGKAVSQLPALQTIGDFVDTGINLSRDRITKDNVKAILQFAPMQNFLPIQYFINDMAGRMQ